MDALSLDQFLVFVMTVDEGSFSGASRRLHRTQSAITYTIQKLEEQIGAPLFDRSAYRPVLTDTGRALLPRARRILADVAQFRSQAQGIMRGLEAEVRLGLSEMVPLERLSPALAAFHADFPSVALRIVTGSFVLRRALIDGLLDIAVMVDMALPDAIERNRLITLDLVAVAAPDHPLARLPGPIGAEDLRDHMQIVLTEQTIAPPGRDYGVAAIDSWRVTDLATKHALLLAGIGWGSMPEPAVAQDIAAGRLMVLPVDRWDGRDHLPRLTIVAAHPRDRPPGIAGRALLDLFGRYLGGDPSPAG